jgi:hypothetical protein
LTAALASFNLAHVKAALIAGTTALLLVGAMLILEYFTANISPGPLLIDGALTEAQQEALTLTLDLVKLLMNWAIGIIAASAFFLKLTLEQGTAIHDIDLFLVCGVILLSVASLFLGHLVMDHSAQMLSLEQFPLTSARVRTFARYQYLAELAAIALFGFAIFQFFWKRRSKV